MAKNTTLEIVTEIGNFGELEIKDPSTIEVMKEQSEDEELDMTKLAEHLFLCYKNIFFGFTL